jgi:hypothetical protein
LALGGIGFGWHVAGAQDLKDKTDKKKDSKTESLSKDSKADNSGKDSIDDIFKEREKEKERQRQQLNTPTINRSITNSELRKRLQQPLVLNEPLDNVPFKDVLEFLEQRTNITIRFDYQAFARYGIKNPDKVLEQPVRIPKSTDVTLGVILRDVLAVLVHPECPGLDFGILVKRGQLAIVPLVAFRPAPRDDTDSDYGIDPINSVALFSDPVEVNAEAKPLAVILRGLADETGANIVLDARAKEKGKTPISIILQEAPLDTAVRLLADMAELKSVALDNILYVTTADNAERIRFEHENAEKKRKLAPKVNPPGGVIYAAFKFVLAGGPMVRPPRHFIHQILDAVPHLSGQYILPTARWGDCLVR